MLYDKLLNYATTKSVTVREVNMPIRIKGLYSNSHVWINKSLRTRAEKACALAEELSHHDLTVGNILNLKDLRNRKQELIARQRAHETLVPFYNIVQASLVGISGRHELAEFLGVTEEFLQAAIDRYKEKYGLYATYEHYTICFEPLVVIESFENN